MFLCLKTENSALMYFCSSVQKKTRTYVLMSKNKNLCQQLNI